MDKFKKAIEQLNKPVNEIEIKPRRAKNTDDTVPKKADIPQMAKAPEEKVIENVVKEELAVAEEKSEQADEKLEQDEKEPVQDIRKLEKELEEEYLSANPESKAVIKKRNKKEKAERKKRAKEEKAENKKKAKTEKRAKKSGSKRKWTTIIVAALIFLALLGGVMNYNLNNQLRPVFYQVQSSKVVDNVRIVAISDMHLKEFGENNIRLVDKIASYHPDIIAIVGDMNIDDKPEYKEVINLCARLNEVAPLYYSLGNHEFEAMLFNDSQIYYDLRAAGINILNNETETIEIGLSTIDVIGLTQGPKQFHEYAESFFDEAMEADDNFKLVLTHYPENFDGVIEEYPIDLAICGHAHGGQVRLPYIGGLYSSDQGFMPKLCDGYHEIENSKVIITKGLGRSGIVPRINNAPEITIIDVNWY